MEYLINYGFALIIITIIIGILIILLGNLSIINTGRMSLASGSINYIDHTITSDFLLTIKLLNSTNLKITGDINTSASCVDIVYGTNNSLPITLENTINCASFGNNINLGEKIGRYFDYQLIIKNTVDNNTLATPYISDLNFKYYK